jgi:hypothetical protein
MNGIYLEKTGEVAGINQKILTKNHVLFTFHKIIILPEEIVKELEGHIGQRVSILRIDDSYFLNYYEKNKKHNWR